MSPFVRVLALAGVFLLATSCSSVLGAETSWDALSLRDLTAQAETATPANWTANPEAGWPSTVPAPEFLDGASNTTIFGSAGQAISVSDSTKPDEDDVVAYIALLFEQGFVVDQNAATEGWFVRDGFEWVSLSNQPTFEYLQAGDFSKRDPLAGGFQATWTTQPQRIISYCRVTEVGGQSCRE